jgi:hypothetical protein
MTLPVQIAVALAAAGLAAEAPRPFEGWIDVKVSSRREGKSAATTERLYISPRGSRSAASAERASRPSVLRLKAIPGVAYLLDDTRRTYRMKREDDAAKKERDAYRLDRIERAKVGKYDCSHVVLRTERGDSAEQWVTADIKGLEHWASQAPGANPSGFASTVLKNARIDGFPVKVVVRAANGLVMTWEVTKVHRQSLPAHLFDLKIYDADDGAEERD